MPELTAPDAKRSPDELFVTRLSQCAFGEANDEKIHQLAEDAVALGQASSPSSCQATQFLMCFMSSQSGLAERLSKALSERVARLPAKSRGEWLDALGPAAGDDDSSLQVGPRTRSMLGPAIALQEAIELRESIASPLAPSFRKPL